MASLVPERCNGRADFFQEMTHEVDAMMEQNVLPFKLELTKEKLTPHGGLVLAHELHLGLGVAGLVDGASASAGRQSGGPWERGGVAGGADVVGRRP